jgi:hypothetical protein
MEYSDETFTTPIPDSMDKRLVPMQIRNKVCQKHLSKTKISASAYRAPVDFTKQDAEEEAEFLNKKVAPVVTRPGFDLQEEDLDW